MNSLQIKYFLALAKYLNFTEAAKFLYVSQPAVSKQISFLEQELGVRLLERNKRFVKLTPAGKMFQEFFSNTVDEFAKVQKQARELAEGESGSLRVGFMLGWDLADLFKKLTRLLDVEFPEIQYSFECYGFRDLLEALEKRKIDVAICMSLQFGNIPNLKTHSLAKLPVSLYYSASHPKARKKNLTLRDFADEPLMVLDEAELPVRSWIISYCRDLGFEPSFRVLPNVASMHMAIENGLGIGFLDDLAKLKNRKQIKRLPNLFEHELAAAWYSDNLNPVIPTFVDELAFLLS